MQHIFTVDVGFTTSRPIIPDQHVSRVMVAADNDIDAQLIAMHMVTVRPNVQMPTSATIVAVAV